jgi:uncharacterized protein YbjT (DUF2867 family)
MGRAFDGVDTLLLVSAHESVDRLQQHEAAIESAVEAGVRRVVYLSFLGAAPHATFTLAREHFSTEELLKRSGLEYTILRDSLYLDVLPDYVGPDGVIRGPARAGRLAPVARDDVADVAVAVLTNKSHHGKTYELTGPEAFTLHEAARAISLATGRHVVYRPETLAEAYASRAAYAAPEWQVEAWVSTTRRSRTASSTT